MAKETLKAILYREETPEEGEKPKGEKYTYEYSRSASSAISEFAPLNSFYAGGKKLNIDQVDINTTLKSFSPQLISRMVAFFTNS